jgi:hypothetical protein
MKDRDTVKTVTNICHKLTERMRSATDTRMDMSDGGIGEHPWQTFTQPKTTVGLLTKTCRKISGWRGEQKCAREQICTTIPCIPQAENVGNWEPQITHLPCND